MKNFLALATFLTVGAALTYGVPVTPCLAGQTLDVYTASGYTCEAGDLIYTNFTYSPTGADPTAAETSVGIDNTFISATDPFVVGRQFGSTTAGVVWSSPFTLSYDVSIDQAACAAQFGGATCAIYASQGQFQDGLASGTNPVTMTDAFTPAGGTIMLNDLTTGSNTNQIPFSPNLAPTSGAPTLVTITGSGLTTTFAIESFGLDDYQVAVPEPATLSLLGGALLGLGLLRRKKVSRQ
jgi:hypothetical protein